MPFVVTAETCGERTIVLVARVVFSGLFVWRGGRYDGAMEREQLERLAARLLAGELAPADFVEVCAAAGGWGTAALGDVTLDLDRRRRCGFPEVVFGEGKSVETLEKIFRRLVAERTPVLATRISADKGERLMQTFSGGRYNSLARTFRLAESDTAEASRPRAGRVPAA